jgi:excisionase family DNA binding protein
MPSNDNQDNFDQPNLSELITLREAAELSGLTTRHLRYLATNGELWAKKMGGSWLTTAQAVREYIARDNRPGPKPRKKS